MDPRNGLFFGYEIDIINLAALGATQVTKQVLDNPFLWMYATATSTGAFTIQVVDGSTKRPFSDVQMVGSNLFGTAQNPFPLMVPYKFQRRGSIIVNVTDLSNALNTIRLSFLGVDLPN